MLPIIRLFLLTYVIYISLSACALATGAEVTSSPLNLTSPPPQTVALKPIQSSTRITAQEFYHVALTHLDSQPTDAMLLRLESGLLTRLDMQGKSASWAADFWSPASRQRVTLTLINGAILTQARQNSPPKALLAVDGLMWELTSFLETAATAGGKAYLAKGYRVNASLTPQGQDTLSPIWTVIYLEPGRPVPAFTVVMDAQNGKVLRSY